MGQNIKVRVQRTQERRTNPLCCRPEVGEEHPRQQGLLPASARQCTTVPSLLGTSLVMLVHHPQSQIPASERQIPVSCDSKMLFTVRRLFLTSVRICCFPLHRDHRMFYTLFPSLEFTDPLSCSAAPYASSTESPQPSSPPTFPCWVANWKKYLITLAERLIAIIVRSCSITSRGSQAPPCLLQKVG